MGYRSQVAFGLSKKAFITYGDKIKEAVEDCCEVLESNEGYVFTWESVKWYRDYDDVKIIKQVMDDIDANSTDEDEFYGFLRIGEDSDDVEESGDSYRFGISIQRTFSIDDDLSKTSLEEVYKPNSIKFVQQEE